MSLILKLLGAVLVMGGSVGTGFVLSSRLRARRQMAAALVQYWGDFLRQMELTAQPPAAVATALAESAVYREMPFAQALASQRENDFCRGLRRVLAETDLTETAQKAMQPLTEALGRLPMEAEKQVLLGVLAALRQEEKYRAEQEARQGTLCRRLGVLGGLALVVLLI